MHQIKIIFSSIKNIQATSPTAETLVCIASIDDINQNQYVFFNSIVSVFSSSSFNFKI